MYDGNPVHIYTGRYPRGIDVSNFKCLCTAIWHLYRRYYASPSLPRG